MKYRWIAIPMDLIEPSSDNVASAPDGNTTLVELLGEVQAIKTRAIKKCARRNDESAFVNAMLDLESLLSGQDFHFDHVDVTSANFSASLLETFKTGQHDDASCTLPSTIAPASALICDGGKTLTGLDESIKSFVDKCRSKNLAIVEIVQCTSLGRSESEIAREPKVESGRGVDEATDRLIESIKRGSRDSSTKRVQLEQAHEAIEGAINSGSPFPANALGHIDFTESISNFVCKRKGRPPSELRLNYGDKSQPRPFPICCIDPVSPKQLKKQFSSAPVLSFALISIRHIEMDRFVDQAWFRNSSIRWTETFSESDEFCYQESLKSFDELCRAMAGQQFTLRLFHTGLEQAVIGFYRAAVEHWRTSKKIQFVVQPCYFGGNDDFTLGRLWPTEASE